MALTWTPLGEPTERRMEVGYLSGSTSTTGKMRMAATLAARARIHILAESESMGELRNRSACGSSWRTKKWMMDGPVASKVRALPTRQMAVRLSGLGLSASSSSWGGEVRRHGRSKGYDSVRTRLMDNPRGAFVLVVALWKHTRACPPELCVRVLRAEWRVS